MIYNDESHSSHKIKVKFKANDKNNLHLIAVTNNHLIKNCRLDYNYLRLAIGTPFGWLRALFVFINSIDRQHIDQFFTSEDVE
jgi:hypothetical protein